MPKKILLADDSITIQKVVELTFSEGDYQVISVGNGTQALKKIQEVRPDIALLDVIMPEANGYEVCEKIKRNPETSWIPVLLLTGTFEPFDRKRADAAGANGHLTKPFESQMLISRVENLIASSRHPVVDSGRVGRMEIVAEGIYRVEGEDPDLRAAERSESAGEVEEELTQHTIVPDRFDDFAQERPAPHAEPEGVRTIRISSDEFLPPPGFRPEEGPVAASGPETTAGTWDELASGLAAAPPSSPPAPEDPGASLSRDPFPHAMGDAGPPPPRTRAAYPAVKEPPAPAAAPVASPPPGPELAGLTTIEVDRIASRVVEQISDKVIREIAWEVIPELAETLIKQRIRELEEKISRDG